MKKCRIKEGWGSAGQTGTFYLVVEVAGRKWAVVLWDDDEDPDLFKAEGLEIEESKFIPLTDLITG